MTTEKKAVPKASMRAALNDPALLGNVLDGDTWAAWRALLIGAMGEPLLPDELGHFRTLTGRYAPPTQRVDELWTVVGRRGGKSRSMSTLATYLAALLDYGDVLAPGENGVVLIIAPDQKQASIILGYAVAAFEQSPILSQLIEGQTADSLRLTTGITLEVRSASFRRLRGPTYCAVLVDEVAYFYSDESANPDTEILNAVRPGLATTGGPLIGASSPYARRGVLWDAYRRDYGPNGDKLILVAQGDSRTLNPSLSQAVVDRAYERDAAAAGAEFGGQFRTDVETFLSSEAIEACIDDGVFERPPVPGVRYHAAVDPSGGSADSFTLALSHFEGDIAVLDCLREIKAPFSPAEATAELAGVIKSYGLSRVCGDRYGGLWPSDEFRKHSITYVPSELPKSDLYRELLPVMNAKKCQLLDSPRLIGQLAGLERRTARGGKDSIDHPPGAKDDLANAAAGALYLAGLAKRGPSLSVGFVGDGAGPIRWGNDGGRRDPLSGAQYRRDQSQSDNNFVAGLH